MSKVNVKFTIDHCDAEQDVVLRDCEKTRQEIKQKLFIGASHKCLLCGEQAKITAVEFF